MKTLILLIGVIVSINLYSQEKISYDYALGKLLINYTEGTWEYGEREDNNAARFYNNNLEVFLYSDSDNNAYSYLKCFKEGIASKEFYFETLNENHKHIIYEGIHYWQPNSEQDYDLIEYEEYDCDEGYSQCFYYYFK